MLKPVRVQRLLRTVALTATFDVFVDLPSTQKGSHLSRNLEAIGEVLDESVRNPVPSLEELAGRVAESTLRRHDYASYAEVWTRADYFLERTSPGGRKSLEPYKLIAKASAKRNNGIELQKAIGVEVVGMTACPCAMETIKERMVGKAGTPRGIPSDLSLITHNQRNVTRLVIDEPPGFDVEADVLIDIVERSMSSPTFELLKRPDEGSLVEDAHRNPKFVEDVVRDVLTRVLQRYPDLPPSVVVSVRSESEESIHKHNAYAERTTTLGEVWE